MAHASAHLAARLADVNAHLSRLDGLLEEVQRFGAALPRADEIERVRRRLDAAIGRMLDPLRTRLRRLDGALDRPAADRWKELEEIAERLDGVAAELLPVAQGTLARAAGLDGGLCAMAEQLVDTLAPLTGAGDRVVLLAPTAQASTRTWVVGLPLREVSVWSLAIVAHELGHVAVSRLEDQYGRRLGEELISGSWRARPGLPSQATALPGPLPRSRAGELFADVFAAFCVGPAYGGALLTGSVPGGAWTPHLDHPAWGARMRAVLRMLDPTPLGWISGWLRNEWTASLTDAGESLEAPAHIAAAVDAFTDSALEVMELTASRARFAGTDVLHVGEQLRRGETPPVAADLRTVINAAWEERLRDALRVGTIEEALRDWQQALRLSEAGTR